MRCPFRAANFTSNFKFRLSDGGVAPIVGFVAASRVQESALLSGSMPIAVVFHKQTDWTECIEGDLRNDRSITALSGKFLFFSHIID
jgi:hypothetical protein